MTTEQMIEVMQHYVDGGEVEIRDRLGGASWTTAVFTFWNWIEYDYRIKPEPKKTKTVWFWRVKTKNGGFFINHMHTEEKIRNLWPNALEYKRMDMLGSEEVEV